MVAGKSVYLPTYNNQGETFTYQVTAEDPIPGYDSSIKHDDEGNWVITNKQVFSPLSLKVTKTSADNPDLKLDGAKFALSGGDLNAAVQLTDNGAGTYSLPKGTQLNKGQTYTLTETAAPDGFEIAGPWQITIADTGKITVDPKIKTEVDTSNSEQPVLGLAITDPVKQQDFQVEKYRQGDQQQQPLAGSKFQLTKYGTDWSDAGTAITSEITGNGAKVQLKPGYYVVKETVAPAGYQLDLTEYKFYIDDHGQMFDANHQAITDSLAAGQEGFYLTKNGLAFVKYDQLKPFAIDLTKVDKYSGKPLKDVDFIVGTKVKASQVVAEATATSDAQGKLNFKAADQSDYQLQPGKTYYFQETKTTDQYEKLKGYFSLKIAADGQSATVTYYGPEGEQAVEVETTISADGNHVTFKITNNPNNPKNPLPSTGGSGLLSALLLGSCLVILAGVGFYFNNAKRRAM